MFTITREYRFKAKEKQSEAKMFIHKLFNDECISQVYFSNFLNNQDDIKALNDERKKFFYFL